MRANRVLVAKGWYWVSTDVNNREGVFRLPREVRRLRTVLHEVRKIYEFEVRELRVEGDRVSFYINAVDVVAAILRYRGEPLQKTAPVLRNLKKSTFSAVFLRWVKAYALVIALVRWGKVFPKTW
jgi:REP element-mobilizing transposase RayT